MIKPYLPVEWQEGPRGFGACDKWSVEEVDQLRNEIEILNLPWEEIALRHGRTIPRLKKYAQKRKIRRPEK